MSAENSKWAPGTFFNFHSEGPVEAYENFKLGMWMFLATELLLFGGLFASLFIFKYKWPDVFITGSARLDWQLGALNTCVLLLSSYTMALGVDAAQRGLQKRLKWMLSATFLMGCAFLVVKWFEWSHKFHESLLPGRDLFLSVYFMTTGLHLAHVLIGMFFIALLFFRSLDGRYNENNFGGVEVGGLYWHLVDIIWIFLFPLLYLLKYH